MKLYLIRHAQPKSQEEDPRRPLSESGRESMRRICEHVARLNLAIAEIWHSSKERARETAQILAEALALGPQSLKEHPGLGPSDEVGPIKDWLADENADLALVGHLPFLSKLASLLLCSSEEADLINFTMGSIVCLSRDEHNRWAIDWMITPDIILKR